MHKYLTWIRLSTCKIELDQIVMTAEYDKTLSFKQVITIKQAAMRKLSLVSLATV